MGRNFSCRYLLSLFPLSLYMWSGHIGDRLFASWSTFNSTLQHGLPTGWAPISFVRLSSPGQITRVCVCVCVWRDGFSPLVGLQVIATPESVLWKPLVWCWEVRMPAYTVNEDQDTATRRAAAMRHRRCCSRKEVTLAPTPAVSRQDGLCTGSAGQREQRGAIIVRHVTTQGECKRNATHVLLFKFFDWSNFT
jgi:hypothetical protein